MQAALAPSIYEYQSSRRYLLELLAYRQKVEPGFSVRRWAKEMELSSNALLVMLLQGKRPLRLQHVKFLFKGLPLSSQERLYFQALIQFENATTPEEKELCSLWLSEIHPGKSVRIKEIEEYQVIAHWAHSVLMALTDLPAFDGSAESAHRLLGGKVALAELRAALERLVDLGYLLPGESGRLVCAYPSTTTKDDVSSAAVRNHQREAMRVAETALEEVALNRREFRTCTFAADATKVALAKEMIRKFQAQLVQAIGLGEGCPEGQLFQFNVQFFQLTERPGHRPEDEGVDTELNPKSKVS